MDFKKHLVLAWEMTLRFIVPLVLMTLVMFLVSFLTLGILAPVMMAGYMHAVLLIIREGREPKIGDLFSFMRLFLPLLIFAVLAVLAVSLGLALLVLPGLAVIVGLAVGAVYMPPLMTDRGLGLLDALMESMRMSFKDNIGEHLVVVLIFWTIQAIGGSFAIGALFTTPIAVMFLMSVYEERISAVPVSPRQK
ncbi:hypothetical protein [Desulfonatronum parangueonense]